MVEKLTFNPHLTAGYQVSSVLFYITASSTGIVWHWKDFVG
jgi:hypothetical protein